MDNGMGPYSFHTGNGRRVFTKAFGLYADALLNVEMLTFSGEIEQANANKNNDLFNAFKAPPAARSELCFLLQLSCFLCLRKLRLFKGTEAFKVSPSQFTLNFMPNDLSFFYIIESSSSIRLALALFALALAQAA